MLKLVDPLGNTTATTYDECYNKTSVSEPLGNITEYEYNGRYGDTYSSDSGTYVHRGGAANTNCDGVLVTGNADTYLSK